MPCSVKTLTWLWFCLFYIFMKFPRRNKKPYSLLTCSPYVQRFKISLVSDCENVYLWPVWLCSFLCVCAGLPQEQTPGMEPRISGIPCRWDFFISSGFYTRTRSNQPVGKREPAKRKKCDRKKAKFGFLWHILMPLFHHIRWP